MSTTYLPEIYRYLKDDEDDVDTWYALCFDEVAKEMSEETQIIMQKCVKNLTKSIYRTSEKMAKSILFQSWKHALSSPDERRKMRNYGLWRRSLK